MQRMDYTVFELSGKQYLIKPGQIIEVDKLSDSKAITVDKVLLSVLGSKVEIGKPYLKKSLEFEVLGNKKGAKIRVATYHAKANYRRVKGSRKEMTKIKLATKDSVKKTG